MARAFTKLMTFWDNDAGSKIHLLANPGKDVAPSWSLQPAVPSQPHEGSLGALPLLSVLTGTYDDTVRNIDIGRVGHLRHSFIAGFPTKRVPKMPLSGVSARSGDLAQSPSRMAPPKNTCKNMEK